MSICTVTSPDSSTPTRVTEPRKFLVVTIPLPFSTTSIRSSSGRASTSTAPPSGCSPFIGTTASRTATMPSPRSSAGIRFITPTNSATNAVAGCLYSSSGAAICSSLPCRMTPTRSAIDRASSWSWVTNRVVVPSRCCRVRICSRSCRRTLASSADNGSSSSSTRGSIASARASATRCCWPPESWCGYCLAWLARPTMSSSSPARLRRCAEPDLAHPQPEAHVVQRGHVREQAVALEHHAHVTPGGRHRGNVLAVDQDLARVGRLEARDDAQRRGLAAAGGTKQRDKLTGCHLDREPVQGPGRSERAAQVLQHHARAPRPGHLPGAVGRDSVPGGVAGDVSRH